MVMVSVGRLKKDGKTKYVKLLGKGILTLVDHLFWNLPFCSVNLKQSQAVRKKAGPGVTEEVWSTKWEEIVAEHDLPRAGAREQLPVASGWKEYLGMRAGEAARGAGAVRPALSGVHGGLGHAVGGCKPGGPMTRAQRA